SNQDVPFEQLVEHLQVPRDLGRHPIFQVMLAFQPLDSKEFTLPSLEVNYLDFKTKVARFDLTLLFIEKENEIAIELDYALDLFNEGTIKRFVQSFQQFVIEVIRCPNKPISKLSLLSEEAKKQ